MISGNSSGGMALPDLAAALAEGLGEGFTVRAAEGYVAIGHPVLGLAAVVPSDDETDAMSAAAELTSLAARVDVKYPSMHFAVSAAGVKPPWVVRASSMGVDILSAMARASATRPPFDAESLSRVAGALAAGPAPKAPAKPTDPDKSLVRMIEACVERALGGQGAWVAGVELSAADVAGPRFMLPALLIAAADKWAIPVVASKGKGGFLIRLSPDPESILGYRVSGIAPSAPLLLFLPIVNLVRRSFSKGECDLNEMIEVFARFLRTNGLDSGAIDDVDVRVATSA